MGRRGGAWLCVGLERRRGRGLPLRSREQGSRIHHPQQFPQAANPLPDDVDASPEGQPVAFEAFGESNAVLRPVLGDLWAQPFADSLDGVEVALVEVLVGLPAAVELDRAA